MVLSYCSDRHTSGPFSSVCLIDDSLSSPKWIENLGLRLLLFLCIISAIKVSWDVSWQLSNLFCGECKATLSFCNCLLSLSGTHFENRHFVHLMHAMHWCFMTHAKINCYSSDLVRGRLQFKFKKIKKQKNKTTLPNGSYKSSTWFMRVMVRIGPEILLPMKKNGILHCFHPMLFSAIWYLWSRVRLDRRSSQSLINMINQQQSSEHPQHMPPRWLYLASWYGS